MIVRASQKTIQFTQFWLESVTFHSFTTQNSYCNSRGVISTFNQMDPTKIPAIGSVKRQEIILEVKTLTLKIPGEELFWDWHESGG